jgi:UDP:flavonoid glycosyltransferase YjiC (YdhE family)
MITHGGMNSITECILAGVPMVVFPGTTQIDQAGNAARVAWHQLGLKGGMMQDSSARIRSYIDHVLADDRYRQRTCEMGARIRNSEAFTSGTRVLLHAVKKYFPALSVSAESVTAASDVPSLVAGIGAAAANPKISP